MDSKNKLYTKEEIQELEDIKLKYNTLIETIPYMTWFMDNEGKYQDVNKEFVIHSGKLIEDIKGKGHKYAWELKVGNECEQNDLKVIESKKSMMFEEIVPGEKGYRRLDIYRSPVINEDDKVIGIVAVGRDITEIKNKDNQFTMLIENIPFEVWQYDLEGNIIVANTKFAKYINKGLNQIIGKNISSIYNKELLKEATEENKKIITSKKPMKLTKKINDPNGKEKIIEVYKSPIFNIGGEVIGIVGIMVDITEINKAKEKIRIQAYTDYNTNLLNRRALYEHINKKIKYKPKTVMILDVDNFKNINDTYGHYRGDELLLKISTKLKEINKDDYVFRFGGDEFLIVFDKELDEYSIKYKAEKIIREISKITIENQKTNVSIGIASCGCGSKCKECRLIIKSDLALNNAKKYKKNGYVIYTEALEKEIIFMNNLEKDLDNAIQNNEIKLVYQPQYTGVGEIVGFEALFRWNNQKYNKISTQQIIEIMESNKSIISIGEEIIRKACVFAKKINSDRDRKLVVSFNVSAIQIMSDEFIESIKGILKETQVSPEYIGIEITESVILEDINKTIVKMNELKALGIKIALDDFGTGYSSFNYLVKLPLAAVKIDKSFSIEMNEYKEYINLIKLIVDASHSLNLDVIAEGVETEEQLKVVKDIGAEYIQGYLFSKPLEEADALNVIKDIT